MKSTHRNQVKRSEELSYEEMLDIVRFVLSYYNCDREFTMGYLPGTVLESTSEVESKMEGRGLKGLIHDEGEREHGSKFADQFKNGEVRPPAVCVVSPKKEGPNRFIIAIDREVFKRESRLFQMVTIAHEARHVVEFPRIPTHDPKGTTELLLLREYFARKFPLGI